MRATDNELIDQLKDLVKNGRHLLIDILRHLQEVEERELHLKRGFPSLFAFCLEVLGYSETQAHTRIQAMRLIRAVPTTAEKLADGKISLSVAAKIQSCFRREKVIEEEKIAK